MALPKHCTALDDRAIAPFLATAKSGIPEDAQCVAFRGSASQQRNDPQWILLNSFSVSCSGLSLSLIMRRAAARQPPREFRSRRVRGAARSEIDFLGMDGGTHENSSTCGGPNDRAYEYVADLGIGLLGICPDFSAAADLSATADLARRSTRHHQRGGRLHPGPEFEQCGRCSGRGWKSDFGR